MVRIGAVSVECDPNFRLYMFSRLPNPSYLPEAATAVNLVNFTITRQVVCVGGGAYDMMCALLV